MFAKNVENRYRFEFVAENDKRLERILTKLTQEMVEYFDSGFVVATYQEGADTKHAFFKFGNSYAIEGLVSNIQDIMYGSLDEESEDDDEEDDGGLKKSLKDK